MRNARAAGQVTLSRGHRSETVAIVELGSEESAPVLKQYVTEVPITRPFFDAKPDSPLEAFVAEAPRPTGAPEADVTRVGSRCGVALVSLREA